MAFDQVDPLSITVWPLAQRYSFIDIRDVAIDPSAPAPPAGSLGPKLEQLAERIRRARDKGASVMVAYGAHLIKNGAGPLLNALIRAGYVTHLATQGAGVIHDWEFAFLGKSSERVRENTADGSFGAWDETGRWINLAVLVGAAQGAGFGEAIGRLIVDEALTLPQPDLLARQIADAPAHALTGARADLLHVMTTFDLAAGRVEVPHPCKQYSVSGAACAHGAALTVHPGIGYDIFTNHPMFHGGALGRAAGTDARIFAHGVTGLDDGVYLSIGSAIMSPQVFEKAMSLANNLRRSRGEPYLSRHAIAIVDLQDGGDWDWSAGEPPKDHPAYYLRFCKTFYRMGGELDYLRGDNRMVLANLVKLLGADTA